MPKVSVIIPAHNEEGSLEEAVRRVERVLSENRIDGEIIVVDDNSHGCYAKAGGHACSRCRNRKGSPQDGRHEGVRHGYKVWNRGGQGRLRRALHGRPLGQP
ncbi:MAG: hypothetical protein B9J98_04490 [Candidatus Terraquivivens tikiterensis]|uniref:Glycosyltransferase 2-like domain-containing protein n=1 Tax=Candidatus Terraquivivens tikiterensis TaxID=1980982 RepID=A0A2R7Y3R4_9ARCH|nr:MAG: hypothetical protein B9J98_04490 [Candidatus Terraquivivens tikiterensis]